jgi:hypothetical protein
MITDDKTLRLALEQMSEMYTTIAALRKEHPNATPTWLAVMAEGFLDRARQLRHEVEQYTGVIHPADAESMEDYIGDVREIDLDNLTMVVRNADDVREVRCTLEESLLKSAKDALDQRVKVSGVRQRKPGQKTPPTLHVIRLEILDGVTSKSTTETGP